MKLIYIRHANKEYNNGDSSIYKHDPGITLEGVKKSITLSKFLIKKYGEPSIIIISPYRRTRETAITMKSVLKSKNTVKIIVDTNLSEYLGNHKEIPMDVTGETSIYNPPHPETFMEMKNRVEHHYLKINSYLNQVKEKDEKNEDVIWLITHGLIIKQIAELIDVDISDKFLPLACLKICDNQGEIFNLFQTKNTEKNEKMDKQLKINNYRSTWVDPLKINFRSVKSYSI